MREFSRARGIRTGIALVTMWAVFPCHGLLYAQTRESTTTQKKARQKSGVEVAKEFVDLLQKGAMPWQFYQQYADLYFNMATQAQALAAKNQAAKPRFEAYAAYCQELGRLVMEMAEHKKTIDEIQLKITTLPVNEREKARRTAANKHDQVLQQFVATARDVPKARQKQ